MQLVNLMCDHFWNLFVAKTLLLMHGRTQLMCGLCRKWAISKQLQYIHTSTCCSADSVQDGLHLWLDRLILESLVSSKSAQVTQFQA